MTSDLEQRLRDELHEWAATTTAESDAYARIVQRAATTPADLPHPSPWRGRIAVLAAIAALVVGTGILITQGGDDAPPPVVSQPPAGPPAMTGLITAAVHTSPCDNDCVDASVTFDLGDPSALTTMPTERWTGVEVLPDGRYLRVSDGYSQLVDPASGRQVDLGRGYAQSIHVAPDGRLVVLALPDVGRFRLRTIDPISGAIDDQPLPPWMLAHSLDVADDGTIVVLGDREECCGNDPWIHIIETDGSSRSVDLDLTAVRDLQPSTSTVTVSLSPQGLIAISERRPAPLAAGGSEHPGWTVVIDQNGGVVAVLEGWQGLAWSPDGSGLLTARRTGRRTVDLRVWFGHDLAQHLEAGTAPLPLMPNHWSEPDPGTIGDGETTAFLLGPAAFTEMSGLAFDQLLAISAGQGPADSSERIRTALAAAALPADQHRADGARPALSPSAVPAVSIEGEKAILDWSSTAAQSELGIWSTSTGSLGMWPIVGMVFENAPDVTVVEQRLDGSCEEFTEVMQGTGCQRLDRAQWDAYRSGG